MSEDQPQEEMKKPLWLRALKRSIKISIILAVIVFGLLTVLSRIGGNSETFKLAVQDFLTDSTPYTAYIHTLNNMTIFPSISVYVEGVELREGDAGTGEAVIRIEAAKISLPFFDVLFRPGHFKNFEIQNLKAMPGTILEQALALDSVSVGSEDGQAYLNIEGRIDENPLSAKIGLETKGKPGKYIYAVGRTRPLDITLSALRLEGMLTNALTGGYKLENAALSIGEEKALRGNFYIDRDSAGQFHLKGQARLEPDKSQLDPNLKLDFSGEQDVISGDIKSDMLLLSDFDDKSPFMRTLDKVDAIFGSGEDALDLSNFSVDLQFEAGQIKSGALDVGSLSAPVSIKDSALHIGPLEGKIINGDLSGDIHLDASTQPPSLKNKIIIKNFDYAALQKRLGGEAEIEGAAHIMVDLKSQGKTLNTLVDALSGKVNFVGGAGRMRSGLLNIWGGGLLNAILPSFEETNDLKVNCVVANLDIENLKGHSDAIFVDTELVTLHGKGTYDFKADNLEMVLEPKPKDVAIGDLSSAVNISGPLSDLTVTPNVFDLGKKVGGLLLGAVNPAFYALTLADLGLNDDHPCKAFVIEKEVLPPLEVPVEEPLLPMPTPEEQPAVNP